MRSEYEILSLILNTAKIDDRIRAVIMNGSRANPNAPRDIFQDFDIVYIVTDVAAIRTQTDWIGRFGELMILQLPDEMADPPPNGTSSFAYLMQFTDGNRIDLTLFPVNKLAELERDSLSILLLDKDGFFDTFAPPNENDYLPKQPNSKQFSDCCNEFWWVCPYVAKGLWREEITYAKYMFDEVIRDQLMKMITWYIGVKTQFALNPGKYGKYYQKHLEPELWEQLLQTYSDASYVHTWDALETMCQLFAWIANQVADHFNYEYPHADAQRVSAHLKHVRNLPKNSQEIY